MKLSELEEMVTDTEMICITETQQTVQKLRLKDNTGYISTMREKEDKRGGGIMIVFRNNENIVIEKQHSPHKDLLYAKCTIYSYKFRIIATYFDTKEFIYVNTFCFLLLFC